jgi:DNA polymerase-1
MSEQRQLCLVDGSGYIFRAFHGLPMMTRPDGVPVNAVYGFTTMLMKLLLENKCSHLAVIFDAGRETFRNKIYADYKAHRPDPPEELIPQFGLIRDAVRAFGVPSIEIPGYEADDLIATYAKLAEADGAKVVIWSADKDLMQLVRDGVSMMDPLKNRAIGPAEVFEKFGVTPDKVIDVQALAGDPTDNVPGVPGIGVKTAAQLLDEYGDLDGLLARAAEIKQPKRRETLLANAEAARISRELVRLKDDVPVTEAWTDFATCPPEPQALYNFIDAQGFRSLKMRVEAAFGPAPAAAHAECEVPAPVETEVSLVTSEAELASWIEAATRAGQVSFDTVTTSSNTLRAGLVGFSLAVTPGKACYVPLSHNPGGAQGQLSLGGPDDAGPRLIPEATALAMLKPLLEDEAVLKIGHDVKLDALALGSRGIEIAPYDDAMLISYVLDSSAHGHGIDELSELLLGHKTILQADICGTGKSQISLDCVPLDKIAAFAAEKAGIALRLHRLLKPRLLAEHMVGVYETMDRPLSAVLRGMEQAGIKIDRAELSNMSVEFGRRMEALEREAHELAGEPFNLGSPKQLGDILFERLNLPGGKKGKTGAYATGADVLEGLAALHPLPRKVLEWRQISKLKSTYADALVDQINARTGRVHTSFAMAATSTGRLSSLDPNLQNIPIRTEEGRRIRRAFIAEPGHLLVSADYSQIELRLVAHVAGIEGLKQAFQAGYDIHAITASQVFGIPVEGMDPMIRRRAKAINFGIIYGISAFGLAQQLGISNGEAKQFIEAYFARYPEIKVYMESTREIARRTGKVTTLFGRHCVINGITDKNPAMKAFAERAAINAPIQGGAADIIKRAMVRLPAALRDAGLAARMLLQVHDELVFEVPEGELEATKPVIKRVMEGAAQLSVPLLVEVGAARTWAEAH